MSNKICGPPQIFCESVSDDQARTNERKDGRKTKNFDCLAKNHVSQENGDVVKDVFRIVLQQLERTGNAKMAIRWELVRRESPKELTIRGSK